MNKTKLLYISILSCLCCLTSCREEFDNHYKTSGESTVSENIVEILRKDPNFSLFVEAIDRLNLAATLGEASIYTCLAPQNKDVEAYLTKNNYGSIQTVPEDELTAWMNYHWIIGMHYMYDIDLPTKRSEQFPDELYFFLTNIDLKTRKDAKHPSKQLRIYTPTFLTGRQEDYQRLKNMQVDPTVCMIENVPLSSRYDIDAANGVIHVLDGSLEPLPRADEAITKDPELSILNLWLEKFVTWQISGINDHGKIDTTKIKGYTLSTNLADENKRFTIIAPTDQALRDYFTPYIGSDFKSYDSIPKELLQPLLTTLIANNFWGLSDIGRGNTPPNYFVSSGFTYVCQINDLVPTYTAGVSSSNAMIYKVNKMPIPPVLHSIEGGLFLNSEQYKQWFEMKKLGKIGGLTDNLQYYHPERTVLVQSEETWIDTYKTVADYDQGKMLDTIAFAMNAGILNKKVENGQFEENTFYSGSYGSLLYKNGRFEDYTGKSVKLVSKNASWKGANGSIYEIDGFLTPLLVTDTNQTIYNMRIKEDINYTLFKLACDITDITSKLKATGYFQYTVLAPTDQAFKDAGMNDFSGITTEELTELVQRHIIQRRIFTDGAYNDRITNLNGEILSISGSWNSFTITDETGQATQPVTGQINLQANNGVLHGISTILKKKEE